MYGRVGRSAERHARRGTVAAVTAVSMVLIIGTMAVALDGGILMGERRRAQSVADSAAFSAACSISKNYSAMQTATGSTLQSYITAAETAAAQIANDNGYANDGTTSTVTVNIPPLSGHFTSANGYSNISGYAEVLVAYNQPRLFSAIWGAGTMSVTARAVARGSLAPYSNTGVIVLDPSAASALYLAGSAHVVVSNAGIQVNSSSPSAVNANNTGYAQTTSPSSLSIVGGYATSSSGYIKGTVYTGGSSVADPLASLPAVPAAGLAAQGSIPGYGSFSINPGVYNGGINFGGGARVTMNSGVYYMRGGPFNVGNGVSLAGDGVTIFLDTGALTFQGGTRISLTPGVAGTYAGVLIYQARGNTSAMNINNGSDTTMTGTLYAPSAQVNFAGGAKYTSSQIICNTLNISNGADVEVLWNAGNVARRKNLTIVE